MRLLPHPPSPLRLLLASMNNNQRANAKRLAAAGAAILGLYPLFPTCGAYSGMTRKHSSGAAATVGSRRRCSAEFVSGLFREMSGVISGCRPSRSVTSAPLAGAKDSPQQAVPLQVAVKLRFCPHFPSSIVEETMNTLLPNYFTIGVF